MATFSDDMARALNEAIQAANEAASRNPRPTRKQERARLLEMVDGFQEAVYRLDGDGVFYQETIRKLYDQVYGLYDIIDGDPIGTFKRRMRDEGREQIGRMKQRQASRIAEDDDKSPF